ncbi:MAG TPA: HEAT repeat domain-containing protein [Aggregatilineaceae bacterium]|nr:HEAT repeat domain-containing protein [Aggregatilineaceae bacterium]
MRLEVLLGGLENPEASVRLDVVRVLGMLDETLALDRLRERYHAETDPAVKEAIAWAGKRLYQAQQAGYSTVDEIFRYFGVDREIENMPDATEAEMMKKLQDHLDRDLLNMQQRAAKRKAGMAAAAALGGMMMGGTSMGMMALSGAMQPGAEAASSSMDVRPQIGTKRAPATAPSNASIDVWAKRLRDAAMPEMREQAALELSQLNNPKALPFLAAAFVGDSAPKVRQAAQRHGKVLYWSTVYWEMEQDGSLVQEMARRAAEVGKTITAPGAAASDAPPTPGPTAAAAPSQPSPGTEPPPVDVADILRKAKEGREARKRKH